MPHEHVEPRLLGKVLRGEATPVEMRVVAEHLLDACPQCARSAERDDLRETPPTVSPPLQATAPEGTMEDRCDAVFDRVQTHLEPLVDSVLRARRAAPDLVAQLQRHPVERQRILIRNNPRFRTLPLADLLLEEAWKHGLEEPARGEATVELVLELLDRIDPAVFGIGLINDLRGRAWAYRGNFRRIRSAVREAEHAFQRAEEHLAEGTGDLLEIARLLGLKATLRRMQRRFSEAGEMIWESLKIYQALGEGHLVGRSMVTQALLLDEQGDAAGALEVLREAQKHIEPERDPYLVRTVQQNLVAYLMEVGAYEEAMALVPALRRRVVEGGNRIELLRLRWQEGKILLGLGHEARAEAAFLEVRKGFVDQGIAHDAASVSLELASLYLRQGRTAEIRDLTRQLVPIFQSRDLHQEALAALLLFQEAVERDSLTLRLVEEVADAVRRARETPRRRSEEPG